MSKSITLNGTFLLRYNAEHIYHSVSGFFTDKLSKVKGSFNLRKAQKKDNPAIKELIQRSLLNKGGIGNDQLYYDTELSEIYEAYDHAGAFFSVLTFKEEIIATVGIRSTQQEAGKCEIKKLYVNREYSGQGHEERLIEFALEKASAMAYSSCEFSIESRDADLAAILLKRGFSEMGLDSFGMKIYCYRLG